MINIISTFYISKYGSSLDDQRTDELCEAFKNNLNSNIIQKIHVFVDDADSLKKLNEIIATNKNSDKIVIIGIKKQPTYHDFFNYILEKLSNNICMIINSDIYLYSYSKSLLKLLNYNRHVYALTRYEYDMTHSLIDNYNGSHDCYIFNSKYLDNRIICENTNFKQNLLGIESRIIKSFTDLQFRIFNPCRQIKIVHLHKTNLRNYKDSDWIGLHKYGDNMFKKFFWYVPPSILYLNNNDGIIYSITNFNNINIILENKKYSWGNEDSFIKFLPDYKMDAFGSGEYKIIDHFTISAIFGNKKHIIKFNNNFTEFKSIRECDLCIVNGKLITDNNYINKTYSWGDSYIKFLDNNKMDAFGEGSYKIIDKYTIIAYFGGREHNIKFNENFTEFISERKNDLCIVNGNLLFNYNLANKVYLWDNYHINFLDFNKVDYFEKGYYKIIDKFNVILYLENKEYNIKFNNNYIEFTDINTNKNGNLVYFIKYL
jgi:hypothetical protein